MDTKQFKDISNQDTPESILHRLEPVVQKFRQTQFRWVLVAIVVFAAFIGYSMIGAASNGEINGMGCAIGLGLAALIAGVIAYFRTRASFVDPLSVATKVEEAFPSLEQRLLTAVSQDKETPPAKLGFLQREVIRETRLHSRKNDWTKAAPIQQWWASGIASLVGLVVLGVVLGTLAFTQPDLNAKPTAASQQNEEVLSDIEITVVPGNAEVERGSSFVVTARFNREVPPEATLLLTDAKGQHRR